MNGFQRIPEEPSIEITHTPIGVTCHEIIAALTEYLMVDDTRFASYSEPAHVFAISPIDGSKGLPNEAWGFIEGTPIAFRVHLSRIRILDSKTGQTIDALQVTAYIASTERAYIYHPCRRILRSIKSRSKKKTWPRAASGWYVPTLDSIRSASQPGNLVGWTS